MEQNNILILRKGTHFNSNKVIKCCLILFLLFNSLTHQWTACFHNVWNSLGNTVPTLCSSRTGERWCSQGRAGFSSDHEKRIWPLSLSKQNDLNTPATSTVSSDWEILSTNQSAGALLPYYSGKVHSNLLRTGICTTSDRPIGY